jgi:3',5'-cyclic-AMP phosphodiesterase
MDRRQFVKQAGLVLAATWAGSRLSWPLPGRAASPEVRLALLADAHLKDGNGRRPEALALARAVAEIRSLAPPPDLVLFAGDLAHRGRPDALDFGREILADLPGPFWLVQGEGDHGRRGNSAWVRRWGEPRFSRAFRGFQVLGLETSLTSGPGGPVFEIGAAQRQWLARELARLAPTTPLIVLSHAPLSRIFHPWQQWTIDAPEVAQLLARFSTVHYLHGHVHGVETGAFGPGSGIRRKIPPIPLLKKGGMAASPQSGKEGWLESPALEKGDLGGFSGAWAKANCDESLEWFDDNHLSLPATAWPRPLAVQGTPSTRRPGQGPRGCGWALITLNDTSRDFSPYLWQT